MKTLILDQANFQILPVPENKDYNFMVKEKKLFDNVLDTLYETTAITCDIKIILMPDGPSPTRLYIAYPKFIKHYLMV